MKVSLAGAEELAESEGIRLKVYKDSGSYPTIGVGHLITEAEHKSGMIHGYHWKQGLKRTAALEIFRIDLEEHEGYVNGYVKQPLKQHQFDALVSFCFNVGPYNFETSTMLKLVNKRDHEGAVLEFPKWRLVAGKVNKGIINRRKREAHMYATPHKEEESESERHSNTPRYHKTHG